MNVQAAASSWSEEDYFKTTFHRTHYTGGSINNPITNINQGNWVGYYYNNKTLNGTPVTKNSISENAGKLSVNSGKSSPVPGKVVNDNFSARYVTKKQLSTGTYMFTAKADNGIRVYLDGKLVLDNWQSSSGQQSISTLVNVLDSPLHSEHWIEVEYYEETGDSSLEFGISPFNDVVEKGKWTAKYYGNENFEGSAYYQKGIGTLAYNWQNGSPLKQIPKDHFSATFETSLSSGKNYFVQSFADDRVRAYIDDSRIIDKWSGYDPSIVSAPITNLSSGDHKVKLQYKEVVNDAALYADVEEFGKWVGYYYNNLDMKGIPIAKKTFSSNAKDGLSFEYEQGSPGGIIPQKNYSAVFNTYKVIKPGQYIFKYAADDGVRVYVDDKLVIDKWYYSKVTKPFESLVTISKKSNSDIHNIRVEYMQKSNASILDLQVQPASSSISTSDWQGLYYKGTELKGSTVTEVSRDKEIAYNWGSGSPQKALNKDYFSASYKRNISGSDNYYMQTFADDGIRVKFDDKTVIDRWKYSSNKLNEAVISGIGKGTHTVETQYFENYNDAYVFADIVPFGDWIVYYFNNSNLSGVPTATRKLDGDGKSLKVDYGYGAPAGGVNKDHFSASYSTAQVLEPGEYVVNTKVDNGFKLIIDGKVVLDRWDSKNYKSAEENIIKIDNINNSKTHKIRLEYKDNTNEANLDFSMIPVKEKLSEKDWLMLYYPNETLSQSTKGTKVASSSALSFNWNYGSPSGMSNDHFSAKAMKTIQGGSDYFIHTIADDGVKVKVDNKAYLDKWNNAWGKDGQALLTDLGSGAHTATVEYKEVRNQAFLYADILRLGQWKAYHYNNEDLNGTPIKTETLSGNDLGLNQNYSNNSPTTGINKDHFSSKYVTAEKIKAGKYVIRAKADDGIKVIVDGKTVIDRWENSKYKEDAITLDIKDRTNVPADQKDIHFIEIQSYDYINEHKFDVSIENYDDIIETDKGWTAEYFANREFAGNAILVGGKNSLNNISEIDFNWGTKAPISGIDKDNFSVRLQKKMTLSEAKSFVLNVKSDDGVRVWVNNKLVAEKWSNGDHSIKETIDLPKGTSTIKVHYFERTQGAHLNLQLAEHTETYEQKNYNYSFDNILDKQMALKNPPPQTDSGGYWHAASRSQVSYYLNPKNFQKGTSSYFQFMRLDGNANLNVKEVNNEVLKDKGSLAGKASTYVKAGKDYNVNEVYLLAHSLLESGNGKSRLATGEMKVNGQKVYNVYGIGAVDADPDQAGANYAYRQGWFTVEKAIEGGAKWIRDNYINKGQNTLYEMRWNPEAPATHQYATDIGWAVKQTTRIQNVYKLLSNYSITYEEPVYSNQPSGGTSPDDNDNGDAEVQYPDNVIGYPTTSLNFRSGPSTNYGIIGSLSTSSKLEILGQNSNGWLQVKANGKTGWVSGSYVTIKNLLQVELDSGTLNVRSGASTSSSSVGALSNGAYVAAVLDSNENRVMENGFSKIYYNNGTAYVYSTYVNVK
ncbi:PA14 domain-containing protein [Terribacillus saccharophilus]|uniref:PA14 domain-containing protein n=1 Tax=Terribacillus saccharophilus TaxID=361277 RepID=UPI003982D1D2